MNVTIKGSSIKKSKVVGRDDISDNNTNIYSETKKVAKEEAKKILKGFLGF